MLKDKRGNTRVALDLEIDYSDLESFCQDYIRNISKGGLFIETRKPLPLGTQLKLKFRLPGSDRPIETDGVVQWVIDSSSGDSKPGMGVQFGSLSDADMDMIDRLVIDDLPDDE